MKIKKILKIIAYTTAFTAIYNKAVAIFATAFKNLKTSEGEYYEWEYGKVFYTKTGEGSPIVLIHDLSAASSGYEWSKLVDKLSEDHTVYVPDLIGCGRSDKPGFSYSNFLYVKFLNEFLKEVVVEPCTIVSSGISSSFTILASSFNSNLVTNVVCINPVSPDGLDQAKDFPARIRNTVLSVPIYGTLLYNHHVSLSKITKKFENEYFYGETDDMKSIITTYHEAAHRKLRFARNFYAAEKLNYCVLPVKHLLGNLKFDLKLIFGAEEESANEIAERYKELNGNIIIEFVPESKHLPQLEKAEDVINLL